MFYFLVCDNSSNFELWKSNGTIAGTVKVAENKSIRRQLSRQVERCRQLPLF
ncbi:MAG: hypothetical protein IPP71_19630 [Bacteroidetes bacterium]|nr:hypothetical protein [Bacteroidota bacterium]